MTSVILEAKGSLGCANWVGNSNGEREKGSWGRKKEPREAGTYSALRREWLISMSPHTQFHQRNTTCISGWTIENLRNMVYRIRKIHVKNQKNSTPFHWKWPILMLPHTHSHQRNAACEKKTQLMYKLWEIWIQGMRKCILQNQRNTYSALASSLSLSLLPCAVLSYCSDIILCLSCLPWMDQKCVTIYSPIGGQSTPMAFKMFRFEDDLNFYTLNSQ